MDVGVYSYSHGDPLLIDKIVNEFLSQGKFDKLRKECMSDADTKPAYQNLQQRVESTVTQFLKKQIWRPDLNKNQLRDSLRKHILESGFFDVGINRIVDQVVNPNVLATVFLPEVEEVVYNYLSIPRPADKIIKRVPNSNVDEKIKSSKLEDEKSIKDSEKSSKEKSDSSQQLFTSDQDSKQKSSFCKNGFSEILSETANAVEEKNRDNDAAKKTEVYKKENEIKLEAEEVEGNIKVETEEVVEKMEVPSDESQESLNRVGVDKLNLNESEMTLPPDSDDSIPLEINEQSDSRDSEDSIMNQMSPISQGRLTPDLLEDDKGEDKLLKEEEKVEEKVDKEEKLEKEEKKPLTFIGRIPKLKREDSESSKSSKTKEETSRKEKLDVKNVYSSDESDSSKSYGRSDSDEKKSKKKDDKKSSRDEKRHKDEYDKKQSDERRKSSKESNREKKNRDDKSRDRNSKDRRREISRERHGDKKSSSSSSSSNSRDKSSGRHKSSHQREDRRESRSKESRHDKRKKEEEKKKSKSADDHGKERNKKEGRRSTDRDSNEREKDKSSSGRTQGESGKREKEQKTEETREEKTRKEEEHVENGSGPAEMESFREENREELTESVIFVDKTEKEEEKPKMEIIQTSYLIEKCSQPLAVIEYEEAFSKGALTKVDFPKLTDDFYVKFNSTGFKYFEDWEKSKLDCEEEFKEFIDEAETNLDLISDDDSEFEWTGEFDFEQENKRIRENSLRGLGNFKRSLMFDPRTEDFYRWTNNRFYQRYQKKWDTRWKDRGEKPEMDESTKENIEKKNVEDRRTKDRNKENHVRDKKPLHLTLLNKYRRKAMRQGKNSRRRQRLGGIKEKIENRQMGGVYEVEGNRFQGSEFSIRILGKPTPETADHGECQFSVVRTEKKEEDLEVIGKLNGYSTGNVELDGLDSESGSRLGIIEEQADDNEFVLVNKKDFEELGSFIRGSSIIIQENNETSSESTDFQKKKKGIRIGLAKPAKGKPQISELQQEEVAGFRISEDFSLPLSPDSDDVNANVNGVTSDKGQVINKNKRILKSESEDVTPRKYIKRNSSQKYDSQDLYKPRPILNGSRTRGRERGGHDGKNH